MFKASLILDKATVSCKRSYQSNSSDLKFFVRFQVIGTRWTSGQYGSLQSLGDELQGAMDSVGFDVVQLDVEVVESALVRLELLVGRRHAVEDGLSSFRHDELVLE